MSAPQAPHPLPLVILLLLALLGVNAQELFFNLAALREAVSKAHAGAKAPSLPYPPQPTPPPPPNPNPAACNTTHLSQARELHTLATTPGKTAILYIICHDEASREVALEAVHCMPQSLFPPQRDEEMYPADTAAHNPNAATAIPNSNHNPNPNPNRNPIPKPNHNHNPNQWVHILLIPSTVFFESIAYDLLLQRAEQWRSHGFVILATYKTMAQKGQTLTEIKRMLAVAASGGAGGGEGAGIPAAAPPPATAPPALLPATVPAWDVVPFLRSGSGMMSNCLYWHKKAYKVAWDGLLGGMNYSYPEVRGGAWGRGEGRE